ncbi:MAG: hypothetical protein N2971_08870, partial [Chlorobi bacterium]|nr:hypothetical protein [Chlorobiota bacterium]
MIDALDILVEDGSVDSWRLAAKHNCSPQYARRILRFMERCRILEGKRVGMRQMEYYLAPDNQQPPRTKQPKLISKKEQSEEDYAERREACFSQDSPKKSRRCPHVWEPNAQMRYGSFVIKPHFPFWRDIARLAREKLGSNNAAGVFVRFVTSRKYTIEQCLHLLKALVHQLKTATRKVTRAYFTWLIRRFDIGGFKKARRKGQRSRFETRIGIATIATIAQIMTCPTNATPAMIVERPYMQRSVEQQQKQPVNSPSIEEKPLAEIDERELLDADTYREYCRLKQAI